MSIESPSPIKGLSVAPKQRHALGRAMWRVAATNLPGEGRGADTKTASYKAALTALTAILRRHRSMYDGEQPSTDELHMIEVYDRVLKTLHRASKQRAYNHQYNIGPHVYHIVMLAR